MAIIRGFLFAVALVFSFGCGSASDDICLREDCFEGGTPANREDRQIDEPEEEEEEERISRDRIGNFLWKPRSESDGRLVVLVNPVGVEVVVTGAISETLRGTGPSNGRGTTGRGSFEGCAYGGNVVVEFFDSTGARVLVSDGGREVTVPNGCQRMEFVL